MNNARGSSSATSKRAKHAKESKLRVVTRNANDALAATDSRKPAKSKPVAKVLAILRQRIASQVLAPGSRLRENELAEELGVSRARIREALGALEERGLVIRIANRGAMVTRLDAKQVFEIFDVRERLEGLCARAAALKAPDGGWADLVELFGAPLEKEVAAGNIRAYLTALIALRERMVKFADNSTAENMLDLVYDKAQVIARRVVMLPERAKRGVELHRQLLAAFTARDADEAERLKRHIIVSARQQVEQYQEFVI
jgi:DNA-binding GntR family transcriptional regulator